jgi:hypothetical protein
MLLSASHGNSNPNHVPLPNISRIEAIARSASVNPIPEPIASKMESIALFLFANISARAKIIQLTAISGRKIPSD